jgi:hypothetical protein
MMKQKPRITMLTDIGVTPPEVVAAFARGWKNRTTELSGVLNTKCDSCQQQFACTSEDGQCTGGTMEYLAIEEELPFELLDFNDVI